jgi:predicted lipid-binding transport protein (Tim44 family)
MEGFQLWDILLFGAIAVFILLRLRGSLGTRPDDNEEQDRERGGMWSARFGGENQDEAGNDPASHPDNNVIQLPGNDNQDEPQVSSIEDDFPVEIVAGVNEIRLLDPGFDIEQFLDGAAGAYEMVINAFAREDYATLRQLLADHIYDDFGAAIRDREQKGETLETTLVTIHDVEPIEVRMDGSQAEITIKFTSEMTNVLKDPEGEIISGSADITDDVIDIWTFARDVRARDPNWPLIATRKAN